MRRALVVTTLVAASVVASGAPARAQLTQNTFGSTGSLAADGRVATVTVLLGCTAPGSVRFAVTLTQGSTTGTGYGGGSCTGETETFTVRVPAGDATFVSGGAQVCGHAVNQEPGGGQDTRDWCRAGGVLLQH
jgi:hypothetical protein